MHTTQPVPVPGVSRARRALWRLAVSAALFAPALGCNAGRNQLLGDLQSPRPEMRAIAVHKLAEQNHPEDLILFTRAAKDVSFLVRKEAATALGLSQDPRVVDLLGELLEDADDGVQQKAAIALADIRSDKSKGYLTVQYGRQGRSTRIAIVQALKAAKVPNAMALVVAAEARSIWDRNASALNEGTLPERVGAAEELGKSGRPEAVSRLEPLIKDSQVILAAAAVRGLGYAGDPRAVNAISELLGENFPELRESAIQALQRLADPKALKPLEAVAAEKSAVSDRAAEALVMLTRSPEVDQTLCALVVEATPSVALTVGQAMRRRGGCPLEAIEKKFLTRAGAKGKRPEKVTAETEAAGLVALQALGPTAKNALSLVLPRLTSSDAKLRGLAVLAAGELGDATAGEPVEKALALEVDAMKPSRADWIPQPLPKAYAQGFDPASSTRVDATQAAERQEKQDDLFKRVQQSNAERQSRAGKVVVEAHPPAELIDDVSEEQLKPLANALWTVGRLHGPHALALLTPYSEDASPSVRAAALAGLAYLGGDGAARATRALLDADREVQAQVALALASSGAEGALAVLNVIPRLNGEKTRLLQALEGTPLPASASVPLREIVQQGGAEAALAARLLGNLKSRDAVDALVKVLDDPTAVARQEALLALGKIGDPRATDAVARDLYNDSPEIRAAAAQSLALLGPGAQAEALEALRGDYYRPVRDAAQRALGKVPSAAGP